MAKLGQYWKFVVAALGVTATVLVQVNVHGTWVTVIVAAASALGVLVVPNTPAPAEAAPQHAAHP